MLTILDKLHSAASSLALSEAVNKKRRLNGMDSINRQKNADCFDLVFKKGNLELGCLEIGPNYKGQNATKYLQERGLKTPRMMKAFSLQILEQYPTVDLDKIDDLSIVISGKYIV